jgi:hypothetical protein
MFSLEKRNFLTTDYTDFTEGLGERLAGSAPRVLPAQKRGLVTTPIAVQICVIGEICGLFSDGRGRNSRLAADVNSNHC